MLTCFVSSQPFLSAAQYYIHFDKDGKIENVTNTATGTALTVYPSVLSTQELHFEIGKVNVPESSFWKIMDDTRRTLSSGGISNPRRDAAIDIQNGVSTTILTPLLATPRGALKYDPSNRVLPLSLAATSDVYKIETTEYDGDLNIVTTPRLPITLQSRDRIEYKLIRHKLDNNIIQQHLEKTAGTYKGWPTAYDELLLDLRQKFRNQGWYIDATLVRDSLQHTAGPMHPFNVDILPNLDELTRPIELADSFYKKVLKDNKSWIESWLWYAGGQVRLNPFPYADPAKLIGRTDREVKELESEINAMTDREVSLNVGGQKDRLAFLLSRLATLKQAREDLGKVNEEYTKWLNKLSVKSEVVYSGVWHGSDTDEIRWLHQFDAARDYRFMNAPKSLPNMVANQDQSVIYTHNLSADDKIAASSTLTPFQPKSGLETTADAIAVELAKAVGGSSSIQGLAQLVAGLSAPSVAVTSIGSTFDKQFSSMDFFGLQKKIKQTDTDHDKPLKDYIRDVFWRPSFVYYSTSSNIGYTFTYAALKRDNIVFSALDAQASLASSTTVSADLTHANETKGKIKELKNAVEADQKAKALAIMYEYFDIEDTAAYKGLIQSYADSKKNLIWISAQTVPILSLNLKPDKNPIYRTHVEFPEKKVPVESSNKVAYTLTLNEKTPVARQTYSKYFTSRFMPSFGLVYVFEDRSALTFDETTGQFKAKEKDFDHIEALVGVKYYPWKTNPARTAETRKLIRKAFDWKANLSRGSSFRNTFYIYGGLGVRRQLLRNYYLGAGVDLFPGLSIQGGGNFIFQKQYELENGKIKNETEVIKSAWYLGLGLDLGLVTNLIKILIP